MTATPAETPTRLPREHIEALADELLRALTPHAGDPDAVRRVLEHWVDTLPADFDFVCIRAVFATFAHCLTPTSPDQTPPGALALTPPPEENQ